MLKCSAPFCTHSIVRSICDRRISIDKCRPSLSVLYFYLDLLLRRYGDVYRSHAPKIWGCLSDLPFRKHGDVYTTSLSVEGCLSTCHSVYMGLFTRPAALLIWGCLPDHALRRYIMYIRPPAP